MTQQWKYGHGLFFLCCLTRMKKMICENVRFSSFPSQSLSILHQNHRFFFSLQWHHSICDLLIVCMWSTQRFQQISSNIYLFSITTLYSSNSQNKQIPQSRKQTSRNHQINIKSCIYFMELNSVIATATCEGGKVVRKIGKCFWEKSLDGFSLFRGMKMVALVRKPTRKKYTRKIQFK